MFIQQYITGRLHFFLNLTLKTIHILYVVQVFSIIIIINQ